LSYYWESDRRFNSWSTYAQKKYGSRLQKVSLNAGFSCPNRDGTIGYGGCTYCNNEGFNPSYCDSEKPIPEQLDKGIDFLKKRYKKASKFIAYFQAYTNTYGPVELLEKKYNEALAHKDIVGISVGTRPDCVDEEKLDLLKKLSEKYFVFLELGVESCYNDTLERINRGHTFEQSRKAIQLAAERDLHITAHLIFGLPGESRQQMLAQAKIISELPITGIKFHQLQIISGTKVAEQYFSNTEQFDLFEMDEYIEFITAFTERLAPWIFIERFCGETPPRFNMGKRWEKTKYDQVLKRIEEKLEQKNTWQGKYFKKNEHGFDTSAAII